MRYQNIISLKNCYSIWIGIGDIQQMIQDSANEIPLDLFLVFDEQKAYIPTQPLVDFIVVYNTYGSYLGYSQKE